MSGIKKGRLTFRSAGALFLLSAAAELFSLTSAVPLLGAIRHGAIAVSYHLVYIALFVVIGIGLLVPKPWGYKALFGGTLFYTLDKALFLLDRTAMELYLLQELGGYNDILRTADKQFLIQTIVITTLLIIACWWGFVLYAYIRRDYFSASEI